MLNLRFNTGTPTNVVSRRKLLQAGFLGIGGLGLADLLRMRAEAGPVAAKKDTAVILLWLGGGPSQLETYDMKPQAPADIRGPFRPIGTKVSGIELCELLPEHAKIADKFTIIRSCHHAESAHPNGTWRFLTGSGEGTSGGLLGTQARQPCLGPQVNRSLGLCRNGMPVVLNLGNGYHWYGSPGDWGETYRVPNAVGGLAGWTLQTTPDRLKTVDQLRARFDRLQGDLDQRGTLDATNQFNRQATEILLSGRVAEAFDVDQEDPRLRDLYGTEWGEQCLVARRLVERGVNLVTVAVPGRRPGSTQASYDWDDHAVNWDLPAAMIDRLPFYDSAVATLIRDVHERGLNEKVLIVVTGEFGRTPRPDTNSPGRYGRDHYPNAMSMLFSGGSGPLGQVIGATNGRAEYPVERPLSPDDIRATILQHLGINYEHEFVNASGRPVRLCNGRHLTEWA
ncbi:MAG: DUF1501 domain-containing protein [Pirellulales bacterium]